VIDGGGVLLSSMSIFFVEFDPTTASSIDSGEAAVRDDLIIVCVLTGCINSRWLWWGRVKMEGDGGGAECWSSQSERGEAEGRREGEWRREGGKELRDVWRMYATNKTNTGDLI